LEVELLKDSGEAILEEGLVVALEVELLKDSVAVPLLDLLEEHPHSAEEVLLVAE